MGEEESGAGQREMDEGLDGACAMPASSCHVPVTLPEKKMMLKPLDPAHDLSCI